MTDLGFYLIAAIVISSAVSAVSVNKSRKAIFSFLPFSLGLAALYSLSGQIPLAVAQLILSILFFFLFRNQLTAAAPANSPAIGMIQSPNRALGMFILFCFVLTVLPSLVYSIWNPQSGEPLETIAAPLIVEALEKYSLVLLALLFIFTVFAIVRAPAKANPTLTQSTGD